MDPLISVTAIMAAMTDVRPGRFYSVDELAAVLRVADKNALHQQLRIMADDPDVQPAFRLVQCAANDFYRRVSVLPAPPRHGWLE